MTPWFDFARGALLFLLCLGVAWPVAVRLALPAAERLLALLVLSLLAIWAVGWAIHVTGAPWPAIWAVPSTAVAGLWWRRRELRDALRASETRALVAGQALVTISCLAWVSLVENYSGGGWAGDWFEHWQRAVYFLDRPESDPLFLGWYRLTARPPMANVITAGLLELGGRSFAHYQLFTSLLSSLAYFPAALLARRWGGPRAIAALTVLVLASPMFVQNATFPWTKLPAALMVLVALVFFLLRRPAPTPAATVLFAAALGAGILMHYSAGIYAVILAAAWLLTPTRPLDRWVRHTLAAAAAGALVLVPWFAWAGQAYGFAGTFLTNTTVTDAGNRPAEQLVRIGLNFRDTLVPHFLRSLDRSLVAQSSPWGAVRDWFFQSYQLNVLLVFGSAGWLVLLAVLRRAWLAADASARRIWTGFVAAALLLGIGLHSARDTWGLAHICLQPLVLIGLARVAASLEALGAGWRRLFAAGLAVDATCGIALHFLVQNFAFDRWLTPHRPPAEVLTSYTAAAFGNVRVLAGNSLETLNAFLSPPAVVVLALQATLFIVAVHLLRSTSPAPS